MCVPEDGISTAFTLGILLMAQPQILPKRLRIFPTVTKLSSVDHRKNSSREDGIEETLRDALRFELSNYAEHRRALHGKSDCSPSNHVLPPPADKNRGILPANNDST